MKSAAMIAARIGGTSRALGCSRYALASAKTTATRALSARSSSSAAAAPSLRRLRAEEEEYHQHHQHSNPWASAGAAASAAAAGAAGIAAAAHNKAACEEQAAGGGTNMDGATPRFIARKNSYDYNRRCPLTKGGVADPMTSYEVYAMKRQQVEEKENGEGRSEDAAAECKTAASNAAHPQQNDSSPSPQSKKCKSTVLQATSSASAAPAAAPAALVAKGGVSDPMTIYERYALKRQVEEEENGETAAVEPKKNGGDVALQATSGAPVVEQMSVRVPVDPMTPSEQTLEEATRKAKQHSGGLKLFSGNGNMSLALEITRHLGINIGKATVGRFADGEVNVVIHENVRGKDVYIIQPTCPPGVNDNIMELLLMVSTLRRASARRITVVIPYYGYARQDRKMAARVPISAADVARLMESMGVDRVIAVDLHCGQIQGFFGPRVPVDNLDGGIVGLDYFGCKDLHNPVIVSPDAGGVYRAKKFKEGLEQKYEMHDLGLAMIVKQRARAGSVDQMDLVGDVKDCDCIIVDDMIDTAGTLCKASDVLVANGARRVFAFASHGLLSGPGNDRIANSKMEEVVILNTIPTSPQREANEKLTELSVAPLLAQAIFNIHAKKSISALFK